VNRAVNKPVEKSIEAMEAPRQHEAPKAKRRN